jgi:hypothetical protein
MYLIDNNALLTLKRERVKSDYFLRYCRVTTDVLREGREHPDLPLLAKNEYDLTPAVLEQVRTVMKTVVVGDTSLVDLYGNKGTADPGLIASARDAIAADEGRMFPDTWVIVTNDRAVMATARKHGISTMEPSDLAALIDASQE